MDYLVVFIGGIVVGASVALFRTKTAAIKQLRKELKLPESLPKRVCPKCFQLKPWGPHLINFCDECAKENLAEHHATSMKNSRPRTMWGPVGDEQGS